MEDEIDLRKYVAILLKHWKLIAGVTVAAVLAAVLVATAVSYLTPPVYAATATVMIVSGEQKTLLDLARSPRIAAAVIDKMGNKPTAIQPTVRDIYIDLTAKSSSPQEAADIANAWAEAFANYATDFYLRSQPTIQELKAQTDAAFNVYKEKQDALSEFQRSSGLNEKQKKIENMELLLRATLLREQMQESGSSTSTSYANTMAFIFLQSSATSTQMPAGVQISIDPSATISLDDVDKFISVLEERAGVKGRSSSQLSEDMLQAKRNLQMDTFRIAELEGAVKGAWNLYLSAVEKSTNAEIYRKSGSRVLRVVEQAVPPEYPVPVASNKGVGIVMAGVLGLIVGVIAAFGLEYFERKRPAGPPKGDVIASEAKQSHD